MEVCQLICNGSGSKGNNYILCCNNEYLIIDIGVSYNNIIRSLNYDISKVTAILVDHYHSDHISKNTYEKFIKLAIPIYSCQEVCDKFEEIRLIETKKKYKIGNFLIQAISVNHSCECYAYIIEHNNMGKMLFATDLTEFPYKIKNCNHILIEANNDEEVIIKNYVDSIYSHSASNTHLSIQKTIEILKANYSSSLQNIILLHLSDTNSDEREFITQVKEELGFDNVLAATNGLKMELKKEDF